MKSLSEEEEEEEECGCLRSLLHTQRGDSDNKQFPQTTRYTPQLGHSRSERKKKRTEAFFGLNFDF